MARSSLLAVVLAFAATVNGLDSGYGTRYSREAAEVWKHPAIRRGPFHAAAFHCVRLVAVPRQPDALPNSTTLAQA